MICSKYIPRKGLLEGMLVKVIRYPFPPSMRVVANIDDGFEVCDMVAVQYKTLITNLPECDLDAPAEVQGGQHV
jgi:hypothetical protein